MRICNHVGVCLAAIWLLAITSRAWGDDPAAGPQSPSGAQTAQATDEQSLSEDAINLLRRPCAEVLREFGAPDAVYALRGTDKQREDDDTVTVTYKGIAFGISHKEVHHCFFLEEWPVPVYGIKMGDDREQVVTVLGKPVSAEISRDCFVPQGKDLRLYVWYSASGGTKTVSRIDVYVD